ncbi:MAG: hypothetical protein ACRDNY_01585 [Gaiellaceae bacterium]
MSLVVAFGQADVVGWICLVVGIVVLLGGVGVGLRISLQRPQKDAEAAKTKLDEAKTKLDDAQARLEQATSAVADSGLESFPDAAGTAKQAAEAAKQSTEAAKTALEQVQGIVASLPENLRFAGLLVLVGTVLMGIATIQFGGVSLF